MLLDLRAIAFPDTQFRASFARPLAGTPSGVNLCGQQSPLPPHTRAAFIWASRVPNIGPPPIHVGAADFIPAAQKTPLLVEVPQPGWKYLDHAREWALVSGDKKFKVPVVKLGNQKALEIDLTKVKLPPGDYKLAAFWDWTPLEANGIVHVRPLNDFKEAHFDPNSQDRLLAGSGKVAATLRGSDFEFISKIELQKPNDEFATPESVRFKLPKGLREGVQDHMDVQIDTGDLDPGRYKLLISQQDGKSHAVDFKVLSNPPKIDNLPIVVNQGAVAQHFVLKGARLEQVSKLEAPGAILDLGAASADQTERSVTVELKSAPQPGTELPVKAYIDGRNAPLSFPAALEVIGPLPVITSTKLSLPKGMPIAARQDEFPSGYTLNALLDVKNIERKSVLRLACADGAGEHTDLRIGEQGSGWSLTQLSPDQLFVAFDTTGLPAGCVLQAVIDNHSKGSSKPFTLARMLLVPQIDSFTVADTPPQNGTRQYQFTGENLELIEKLGWDDQSGLEVPGLPVPLRGPGLKQSIQIGLPDPPSLDTVVYVWLRGDKQGRATTINAPVLPPEPPPQILETPDSSIPPSATPDPASQHQQ